MIKSVTQSIAGAARRLFGNWRVLLLFVLFYGALLGVVYWFIASREGSISQLLLTLLLAVLAPVLFFIIQAMAVSYTQPEAKTAALLRLSLREFWKLALITVPILLLAWLIIYLLERFGPDTSAFAREAARSASRTGGRGAGQSIQWGETILTGARFLFLGIILPLMAVHLWIGAAGSGLGRALKGMGGSIVAAFRPSSLLIYIVGALLFGLAPWFLVFSRTSSKSPWLEVSLLGVRLVAAATLMLLGWLVTVGALRVNSGTMSVNSDGRTRDSSISGLPQR